MVDESFHLTPIDVRRYDFGSALRGYDKARVDQFREQVAEELERLARVAAEFEAKAKGFHEQLRAFRERDKALNDALISAQQMSGTIREQADREGQLVLREAKAEAERLVDVARSEVRRLQTEVDALHRMERNHLAQLRAQVQRQLTEIEAAEHAGEIAAVHNTATEIAHAVTPPPPAPPPPAAPVLPSAPPSAATPLSPTATAAVVASPPSPAPPMAVPPVVANQADADADVSAEPDAKDSKGGEKRPSRSSHTPLWLDASVPE